jgi:Protein of unknown function (DUF3168)
MTHAGGIYQMLKDDALFFAAIGGRVYPDVAPDGKTPYAVYTEITDTAGNILAGKPAFSAQTVQLDIYARERNQADTIGALAENALQYNSTKVAGFADRDQQTALYRRSQTWSFITPNEE